MSKHRLCLIEDDPIMGESLVDRFQLEGYDVDWHQSAADAMKALPNKRYAVAISDIRLPDLSGDDLYMQMLNREVRLPPFIFITGFGSIERAVQLLKLGASDYITKPFELDQLVDKVASLCRQQGQQSDLTPLGVSPAMLRLLESLPRLAQHASAILVTGESGVGKERVAEHIHQLAHKGQAPFVPVNCGAIPETLFESELFGHEKGAFTGAMRLKKGYFEQAHGGTLFLDEIGELPLPMQVKLLRAIQERRFARVGGEAPINVDLRLICATNRDLKKMVEAGQFREDLFYRINVIHLKVPPLRERKEDIAWLARQFMEEFAASHGREKFMLHPKAEQALADYPWPGNARELKHYVERACIMSSGSVLTPDLFFDAQEAILPGAEASLVDYLHDCERRYIQKVLEQQGNHMGQTAAALGISRKSLWEKMKKLGLQESGIDPA